ncbi:alpha/beta hydrolase [Flavobacterium sp.]|uniref:alpha/beta hydrolase n=1 Tax=Flavobacterium sp. TaxID=239 RepID=UPI002607C6A7|nr:alpha/beta hydrolase [Flavobacterium sp.]MDD2986641.1 alpha/beta hydrolase [Flavobacterium sp.]
MEKIPVYFMPGLAASPAIFERINLPEESFSIFFLEWLLPLEKETLSDYAFRMTKHIHHENPVLIGVSFGGVLVQEMAKLISVQKIIIISSVKTNSEFPKRMKFAKTTKAYKLLPTGLVHNIENLSKFAYGEKIIQRLKLYEKYLSVRDKSYLDWSLETIILWDRTLADDKVIHIHGDADEVFPYKNITKCITIKGGTHIMILNKYKWFNENLPKIILNE